jgi:hypothetical protein
MAESVLRKKSYSFALKVIKVYKLIVAEKKEYVLSKQFLDCLRTSVDLVGELVRLLPTSVLLNTRLLSYFFALTQKSDQKNSRLQIISGLIVSCLPTHYNSPAFGRLRQ